MVVWCRKLPLTEIGAKGKLTDKIQQETENSSRLCMHYNLRAPRLELQKIGSECYDERVLEYRKCILDLQSSNVECNIHLCYNNLVPIYNSKNAL